MLWFTSYLKSSVGAKTTMAVSGLAMVLFAFVHMLGNLQVFASPTALNEYAVKLRELGPLLWVARLGLVAVVILHVGSAFRLVQLNRAARPTAYSAPQKHHETGIAARTMAMSGVIILAFIAFHLAHYTFLVVNPEFRGLTDAAGRHDVHSMVVAGFGNPVISLFYIMAVGLLCVHLSHGIPSFFQTLGLRHPKYTPAVEVSGPVLAGLLFIGFAIVPLGVMFGWAAP
jgi:succinate dehydrogenase / fumarate reductase cytochrome b subunit